jgi:predicted nucleotidyltransferase
MAEREIQQMVRRIVSRFHPEKIILFGSHARGEAGPDSDVDLLVVMPLRGSKLEKLHEIRLALSNIHVPKDVVVTTPEDFLWRKEIPGTIERPAAREGKILASAARGPGQGRRPASCWRRPTPCSSAAPPCRAQAASCRTRRRDRLP